jgi:hypothetical protein
MHAPTATPAIAACRRRGHGTVTLGNDPNLYGHIVKPGLFSSKARLGFTAVPAQGFLPGDGRDEADRVVDIGPLADPALVLGRAGDGRLRADVFTRSGGSVDVRPFRARFLAGFAVREVAAAG